MMSKKEFVGCLFCDSKRHSNIDCPLYNRLVNKLYTWIANKKKVVNNDMFSSVEPDFKNVSMKKLKLMAFCFPYTDAILHSLRKIKKNEKFSPKYEIYINRNYNYRPIDLTQDKKHLIISLKRRWRELKVIFDRIEDKNQIQEEMACPICMEDMVEYKFRTMDLKLYETTKTSFETTSGCNPIITTCKHIFCYDCFHRLQETEYGLRSCPLCRNMCKVLGNYKTGKRRITF